MQSLFAKPFTWFSRYRIRKINESLGKVQKRNGKNYPNYTKPCNFNERKEDCVAKL